MPSCSAAWLMFMNVLYFIFGIAMIGMSSWGITVQKSNAATAGARCRGARSQR
jgi:hypothetical protein